MKQKSIILIIYLIQTFTLFGQVSSIDTFPVYKIIPDTLIKGVIDSTGKRQGVYYQYNDDSTINFIRTYKNDTLNGFLGCYSPKGFVNSEQFYKNGERDSLWFDYSNNNTLSEKGYYKNGLKHGIFLEFYDNGNIKYEGYFQNDTLIGNEIYYNENKTIRSIGSYNGLYKTFFDNGELKSITIYKNQRIIHKQSFCQKNSKQMIIKNFIPIEYSDKKFITNETKLKVDVLASNYSKDSKKLGHFINGFRVIEKDSFLIIIPNSEGLGNTFFKLTEKGIQEFNGCVEINSDKLYTTHHFSYSGETKSTRIFDNPYNLIVNEKGMRCNDTGNNTITIENNNKKLELKTLYNLCVFEYDANKDGEKEYYIISFESCVALYKIIRIKK